MKESGRSTEHVTPGLDELFSEHHKKVFMAAYRVTGNPQDAEDILQSVFLRLLDRAEMPSASHQLGGYLRRAAVNQGIDLLRSRKRAPQDPLQETDFASTSGAAEAGVERSELQRRLRTALLTLDPASAEVFALRYFEDYSNAEIARILESTPNCIAVTLHRARARLQESLGELSGEDR